MKRREFIKKSVGAGVVAGTALSVLNSENLFAINKYKSGELPYDLVAIKGGGPEVLAHVVIGLEGLGGVALDLVALGQQVLGIGGKLGVGIVLKDLGIVFDGIVPFALFWLDAAPFEGQTMGVLSHLAGQVEVVFSAVTPIAGQP